MADIDENRGLTSRSRCRKWFILQTLVDCSCNKWANQLTTRNKVLIPWAAQYISHILWYPKFVVGWRSRYTDWLRPEPSGDRIPVGGEIFRTRPDRHWVPPSRLYRGYWPLFPGVMRPGRGVHHPPSYSAEVRERVELYLSPSGPSRPVLGRTLPLPLPSPRFATVISRIRHWRIS
jgi:hypothetical protein